MNQTLFNLSPGRLRSIASAVPQDMAIMVQLKTNFRTGHDAQSSEMLKLTSSVEPRTLEGYQRHPFGSSLDKPSSFIRWHLQIDHALPVHSRMLDVPLADGCLMSF